MQPYIKIPLDAIIKENKFVLKGLREIKEYNGNIVTGNIIGYRYTLVDCSTYETIQVKIIEKKASFTQSMIEKSQNPIIVSLQNPTFSFYVNQGRLAITFSAESIILYDDDIELIV